MPSTYQKIDDKTFQATTPQPDSVQAFNIDELNTQVTAIEKQIADTDAWYAAQIAYFKGQLEDANALIAQANSLGIQ